MADKSDFDLEEHRARLRRREEHWRALHQQGEASDKFAVEIGLVALRTAFLMNAGAVLALLTFVGHLWDQQNSTMQTVLTAMRPFVFGVLAAGVAAGIAYFYQSFVTAKLQEELKKHSANPDAANPTKWFTPASGIAGIVMVALVIASQAFFACGALAVIRALDG